MFGTSLQIEKWWNATFHNPNQKLVALMPELLKMKSGIQDAMAVSDPLEGIVDFFNAVNPVFDRSNEIEDVFNAFGAANYNDRYKNIIDKLSLLITHLRRAGRDRYGINRAKVGEPSTAHNVFLGDIWGLFTKNVYFWKTNTPDDPTKCGNGLTASENIRLQAKNFMQGHLPMIEIIEELQKQSQQG